MSREPTPDEIAQADIEWEKIGRDLRAKLERLLREITEAENELAEYDRTARKAEREAERDEVFGRHESEGGIHTHRKAR